MLVFHLHPPTPKHVWHPPQGHCELTKVTLLLRTARLNYTNRLFFKSPKILRSRFRCMTSFTSPGPGIFILTSVNDTSSLTPALKFAPHPCAELKGSQPNQTQRQDIFNEIPRPLYYTQSSRRKENFVITSAVFHLKI